MSTPHCDRCNSRKKVMRSVVSKPSTDFENEAEVAAATRKVGDAYFRLGEPLPEGFRVIAVCMKCRERVDHHQWVGEESARRFGWDPPREEMS